MLEKLKAWLAGVWAALLAQTPPPVGARDDLFDPEEVLIYTHLKGFDDRAEKVFAQKDPYRLWMRLMTYAAKIDEDLTVANSTLINPEAANRRYNAAVEKAREVFEVLPFDQGGLPDPMVIQLYWHFVGWLNSLKKTTPPPATSAQATTRSTSAPSGGGGPTTGVTSGSGSTATAGSTASPTPSDSASAPPTAASNPAAATTT